MQYDIDHIKSIIWANMYVLFYKFKQTVKQMYTWPLQQKHKHILSLEINL